MLAHYVQIVYVFLHMNEANMCSIVRFRETRSEESQNAGLGRDVV